MRSLPPITGDTDSVQRRHAPGVSHAFPTGDDQHACWAIAALAEMGVQRLRVLLSWSELAQPHNHNWFDTLLPALARRFEILPCIAGTPRALADGREQSPPSNPKAFADFLDTFLSRYGDHISAIQLWDNPLELASWDRLHDPTLERFSAMIGMAAHWLRRCGKQSVLGPFCAEDGWCLELLADRGVLEQIDGLALARPRNQRAGCWRGWPLEVEAARALLGRLGGEKQLWIIGDGAPLGTDEGIAHRMQLQAWVDACYAPVDRVYASPLRALYPTPIQLPAHPTPTLLGRTLASGGTGAVERLLELARPAHRSPRRRATLITGGAGFVGSNLAARLLTGGEPVIIYDSLSRPGVERNAAWLKDRFGPLVELRIADVRDRTELRSAIRECSSIFHFAAQVAVTTSLDHPLEDLDINIRATAGLLEEVRRHDPRTPVLFTSTNKVYGHLDDVELTIRGDRYEPADAALRDHGISEARGLEFCSPYGCSKGAADQYMLDYARTFGVPSAVFRMSCIYGPRQWGTEDQGWIAFFLRAALKGEPISIYGDGRQVRDALFVEDLVDAFLLARDNIGSLAGRAFNIGGGPENTLSLIELLRMMSAMNCEPVRVLVEDWRPADQRWYVSDTRAFRRATGWDPRTGVPQGLRRLLTWLQTVETSEAVAQPLVTAS